MNAPKEGIGTQRIKWIHRDLRQEPAEAQKASFGLGVALVCRVVCPPGVYAYPGFASIICFGVVRPCGASELMVSVLLTHPEHKEWMPPPGARSW